jgi:oligopeptide/dipeptide ABC transporter ATP-binding protein
LEHLLNVEDLKTYFFTSKGVVHAVDGVNFYVDENEAVGIVGESGCGKTMSAFSVMQLVPSPPGRIVGGRVIYQGKDLLKVSDKMMRRIRGKEIAMVFQDPMTYLNPVLRIKDQLGEAIILHRGKEDIEHKVQEALELVRIPAPRRVANGYPHELSGGMRQRVLIAFALACHPRIVIADEPTTSLDVTIQAQILELLKQIRREIKTSIVLISHDLGLIAEACDRVYVMYAGGIVEHADVIDLYENPKHPYTIGLLRSVLSIDEFKEDLYVINGNVPNLIDPPSGCRFHPRCSECLPICTEEPPPFINLGNDERVHEVSCWLFKG